ncbi:MAG: helix-turn-helix domain-containing protein [Actinomycetes bacterium]
MTPKKLRAAQSMLASGESVAYAARTLGVSRATIYRGVATARHDDAA